MEHSRVALLSLAETPKIAAFVPGSVQASLENRAADLEVKLAVLVHHEGFSLESQGSEL